MKRPDEGTRRTVYWLLDEADRYEARASELDSQPKPPPVADVAAMTDEWVTATLGAEVLRGRALELRRLAARLAKIRTTRRTEP